MAPERGKAERLAAKVGQLEVGRRRIKRDSGHSFSSFRPL